MSEIFLFVLAIIALCYGYKLLEMRMRQQEHEKMQGKAHDERSDLAERCAQLEERVRVLERIVTDNSADLRQQFKDLGG